MLHKRVPSKNVPPKACLNTTPADFTDEQTLSQCELSTQSAAILMAWKLE